eukprot:scaffold12773_cov64-Phaeocystis_antarctica.AAC.9
MDERERCEAPRESGENCTLVRESGREGQPRGVAYFVGGRCKREKVSPRADEQAQKKVGILLARTRSSESRK